MGKSKLYVRRTTPSPPPRHARLSMSSEETMRTPSPPPPLPTRQIPLAQPRSVDARQGGGRIRPSLRHQRSFSPSVLRLNEDSLRERVTFDYISFLYADYIHLSSIKSLQKYWESRSASFSLNISMLRNIWTGRMQIYFQFTNSSYIF